MITNMQAGTRIDEVGAGIYRISTPLPDPNFEFCFNQYLLLDDEPLLFHTGPRGMFPLTREAIEAVLPLAKLRWIGFSHFENDECGALNALLAHATNAQPVCGRIEAMTNADAFDRAPRALADGEQLLTGRRKFRWFDTPHVPHGWDCGYLFEESSQALLCGDLFTQPGAQPPPLAPAERILDLSDAMIEGMNYFSRCPETRAQLERLASTKPALLACMHGSAFSGDGSALLMELTRRLKLETLG